MKKYLSKGNVIWGLVTILFIIMTATLFEEASLTMPLIRAAEKVQSDKVAPENNGKIVLVSGRIKADGYSARDETFDIRVDAPILRRNVDMYQWVKYYERNRNNQMEEHFRREWSDAEPIYHEDNPRSKPYQGRMFYSEVMLGEYKLSQELAAKLAPHGSWTPVGGLSGGTAEKYGMVLTNDIYYIYHDIENEYVEVGDTRIYFHALDISGVENITVLAKQEGNMLTVHRVKDNLYPLGGIYAGIKGVEEVAGKEEGDYAYAKWVLAGFTVFFAFLTALFTWLNIGYARDAERTKRRV